MKILGIETSCDETAAAIVKNGREVLSRVVTSSVELHKKTGGIIPEVAAREQVKCIIPVIKESLKKCKSFKEIDAIAVTVGPGLIGSLLVGVETARTLSYVWQKPIIPINHLQAHLYANFVRETPDFPIIGLVVSGGHTDLVLMKGHGQIKWLGGTRDDAAGECFDKTARLLGLSYPGGPEISRLAERAKARYDLPRPILQQKNLDFSFSGLKTAVLHLTKKEKSIKGADLAASIQEAIVEVLVVKTMRAVKKYQVKSILLAGGVAANFLLRKEFKASANGGLKADVFIPPINLCVDNAVMIASCAYFNYYPMPWKKIKADSSLRVEEMIKYTS